MTSKSGRFRPSPGLVVSVIAVFFAIGGIGYAAATIGTNDIRNGAVTKKKLHRNAVVSKKVKDHSLHKQDLANDAIIAGPRGPSNTQLEAAAATFSEGTYSFVGNTSVKNTVATGDVICSVSVPGASTSSTNGFEVYLTQNQNESATVIGTFRVAAGGSATISINCGSGVTTSNTNYLVTRIGSDTL